MGRFGEPAGDLTPCGDICFPYDPALAERSQLAPTDAAPRPDLQAEQIVETYTYGSDGAIAVTIENSTHGYRRSYVIGAMA